MPAPNNMPNNMTDFDVQGAPQLIVLIDAEEEFQWRTFSRGAISVRNMAAQTPAQKLLEEFGVKPAYLIDYAVASQPEGFEPLLGLIEGGLCTVGAQLHPWINPPFDEPLTLRNTYPGNLPAGLEQAKIAHLTAAIRANLKITPTIFKAGRYGAGPNTSAALLANGYQIDTSVMPLVDFSADGGPDHSQAPAIPYWIDGDRTLLEIPNTVGLVGLMDGTHHRKVRALLGCTSTRFRIPGLLARLGLLERIRLTPEGISLKEAQRLTTTLLRRGHRLFVLSYHSSSLLPGGAPYVRNQADLAAFLGWLRGYLRFFFGPLSGRPATANGIYNMLRAGVVPAPSRAVA